MADATRLHVMSKQIDEQKQATKAISIQIEKLTQSCGQIETLVQSQKKLESMITAFMSHGVGQQGRTPDPSCSPSGGITSSFQGLKPPDPPDLDGSGQISGVKRANEVAPAPLLPNGMSTRLTKVGFPMFDGTKFRDWVYRCEQFFRLDGTPLELKAELAAAHLEGKALQFHQNFLNSRYGRMPSWTEYVLALANRFGEAYDDPLADLVKLKQSGDSVETYLDKFECALTRLSLPEPHALSIFLTNLNPKLALYIRGQKASTVTEAARLARLHESYLLQTPQQTRAPFNPNQKPALQSHDKTAPPLLPSPEHSESQTVKPRFIPRNQVEKPIPKKFSYEEMQERRSKGLCMFCDEPYTPGHGLKHKRAQIFVLDCEEEDAYEDVKAEELATVETPAKSPEKLPVISINALNGSTMFNCMRLMGQYGKKKLHVLIDPGSTHNFLDMAVANEVGCLLEAITPTTVAAANGDMVTKYKCSQFSWRMQGYQFIAEIRTLPLTCCDLVLGVQWLTTLGPIWWDFSNLRMEFHLTGVKHVLRGSTKEGCKVIKGGSMNKLMLQEPQIALLQIREVSDSISETQGSEQDAWFAHIAAKNTEFSDNVAVDALSRVAGSQLLQLTLSQVNHDFYDSLILLWQSDPYLRKIISELQAKASSHPTFSYVKGELRRKGGLVVGNDSAVKLQILKWLRDSAVGEHSGRDATLQRVKALFFWPRMSLEIQNYVRNCPICQKNKYDLAAKPGESSSVVADRSLQKREEVISMLKFHLLRAQNRMKQYADAHRSQREFNLGNYVYLKLQPYRQQSLKSKNIPHKLSPRFYGPFHIFDKMGSVAYILDLPPTAIIHDVFHVSQLKLCSNPPSTSPALPQYWLDIGNSKEPEAILDTKVTKVLVQWKGSSPEQATWEFYQDLIAKFPDFQP